MFVFLLILTIVVFLLLVIVAGMRPPHSKISSYELERRAKEGDRAAEQAINNDLYRSDIESILRIKVSFLLVVTSFLLVTTLGWIGGGIISLVVILEYGAIARIGFFQKQANQLYTLVQPRLLIVASNAPVFMKLIRSTNRANPNTDISSRYELQHLIDQSEGILSSDEKKLVVHSLAFSDKTVADIMTPVSKISSIKKSEFLGPLTLDELHQTGHSRLPVIGADIDHIVGILYLQGLLALDIKRSVTAEKAMDPRVHYVRQDQTLPRALAALLRTHQHLFIVVDNERQTVGLITLDDIIEALIGHKIIDDFDGHESLRAVAEHTPGSGRSED